MTEDKKKENEIPKEQLELVNGGSGKTEKPVVNDNPDSVEHVVVDSTPSGGSTYLP